MHAASRRLLQPWAVVEITDAVDESERTELIRAAYQSSRSGLVALALRGVTPQVVDRALDSVVDTRSDQTRGVVYMDANEAPADVMAAASRAVIVVASSEGFRVELQKHGINASGVDEIARMLRAAID